MYVAHGTYPFPDWKCGWMHICNISKEEAEEHILNAITEKGMMNQYDEVGSNGEILINKGFRVVFVKHGLAFAVYAKDWEFRLIACPFDKFVEEMRKNETQIKREPPKVLLGHEWIKPRFPCFEYKF